jgi:hypothetical protein
MDFLAITPVHAHNAMKYVIGIIKHVRKVKAGSGPV